MKSLCTHRAQVSPGLLSAPGSRYAFFARDRSRPTLPVTSSNILRWRQGEERKVSFVSIPPPISWLINSPAPHGRPGEEGCSHGPFPGVAPMVSPVVPGQREKGLAPVCCHLERVSQKHCGGEYAIVPSTWGNRRACRSLTELVRKWGLPSIDCTERQRSPERASR